MQIDAIDATKTAMIVVDMQNDFVAAGAPVETPAARAMGPKLVEALKICRSAGMHVIYTAHALIGAMAAIWAGSGTCTHWSPAMTHWWMVRRAWMSTLNYPAPGEHVIKKHRYSGFLWGRTSTSSCVSGVSVRLSFPGQRRRIVAMQRRGMPCSATIVWCSCRTQRRHTTIPIEALVQCRMRTFTARLW